VAYFILLLQIAVKRLTNMFVFGATARSGPGTPHSCGL